MAEVRSKFWCKIGGAIGDIGEAKFGWLAPHTSYNNIGRALGVMRLGRKSSTRGILFGANFPKPAKVAISFRIARLGDGGSNDSNRRAIRYCDTDKLGQVLNGGLRGKKVRVSGKDYDITAVSIPG